MTWVVGHRNALVNLDHATNIYVYQACSADRWTVRADLVGETSVILFVSDSHMDNGKKVCADVVDRIRSRLGAKNLLDWIPANDGAEEEVL